MASSRASGISDPMDRPSLSLNERVVWISDSGPEYGYVRWLGRLPDLGREWMAGVEFDNPVGSGTGLYRDRQLFLTPLNHASLVPVIGLLKASDFDGPPQPPTRSSSVRLIDFGDDIPKGPSPKTDRSISVEKRPSPSSELKSRYPKPREYPSPKGPSTSRERVIPITVEGYESMRPSTSKNYPSTSKDHKESDESERIDNLTTALKSTSLKQKRSGTDLELLPDPPLVYKKSDKDPSKALSHLLGKSKGIQGHANSCYLDATLFAMFSSTKIFDSLLYRPANRDDIAQYNDIQRILRENIVRPLRTNFMVHAEQVMSLRTILEKSSKVEGLTDEEKDPEEFLTLLLSQMLKAEPYLKLSSGLDTFLYQLIVEKDPSLVMPSVQDLFEQSFLNSPTRLSEIPPCLILQMPRFGKQYKMYPRIYPTLRLDITNILESVPRACGFRGKDCDNLACYECKKCFDGSVRNKPRLESIAYCNSCFISKHFGRSVRTGIEDHDHHKTHLSKTPKEAIARYSNKQSETKNAEIPRILMDLFAVLCIETSHYVCFVKCGKSLDSPWCFFDSMADRQGEQDGYNIPEVLLFDEFPYWTSEDGVSILLNTKDDKSLPDMARRLICDSYLCFYRYDNLESNR